MSTPYPYEIRVNNTAGPESQYNGAFNVCLFIPVSSLKEDEPGYYSATNVIDYLRSGAGRALISGEWLRKNYPGFGTAAYGAPRPEFEIPGNRQSKVLGYVSEFRLTPIQ